MQFRQLGSTGLIVSELCLGAMIFGEKNSRGTSAKDAHRLMTRFVEAGGNFIDTANVYADGRSEEIIGQWLKGQNRHSVIIATKVRHSRGASVNDEGLSRAHILTEVENSLRRLGTDYIDLYYVHMWDHVAPLEETLRAFDDLVKSGKVRYIGVSNYAAWQVMKALAISDSLGISRFVAAQYQYSLVVRDLEYEFLPLFESEKLALLPWGPLGGGFLSGKYRRGERPASGRIATMGEETEEAWHRRSTARNWDIIDAVSEIAQQRGKTYPQVALNWLLTRPAVASIIIGARTLEQMEDNLGASGWRLDPEELDQLDGASALPEAYPYRMMVEYGGRKNWPDWQRNHHG